MRDREGRLEAVREEAAARGRVEGAAGPVTGAPFPAAASTTGYYGHPLLKAPVWTWEVPAYFFVGGAAGAAAVIAAVAAAAGADPQIARDARGIAACGALLSPLLLVADLGRPSRFLNMLRVFKLRSPMSVGAWALAVFSAAAVISAGLDWLPVDRVLGPLVAPIAGATSATAAVTGLVLATYTGVLLGVTAIPVWAAHARLLPAHFGASAFGAAVGAIELAGHRTPTLNLLGISVAAIETAISARLEWSPQPSGRVLREGAAGAFARLAGVLGGPLPLVLRLAASHTAEVRVVAAVCMVVGSLLTRLAWTRAGVASAADPRAAGV